MNANGINRLGPVCLLIAYCAQPAGAIDYTWNLGDTGGNWGDEANWDSGDGTPGNDGFPDDTGDTATLLAPVVARYVTNDAARTIGNLAMGNNANNRLWLEDDLTVDAFNGGTGVRVYVNGHVFTFGNSADIGDPRGGGTIRKVGTGGSSYRYTANFTGDMIIDEGSATLAHNSYSTWNSVHATNSAGTGRLILSSRVLGFPPNIYLMGDGDGSGALFMSDSDVNVDLHLLGDTSIGVASGKTLTIREDIIAEGGAYVLTKRGAGTLEVAYLDGYSFSNMIVVAAGTLEAYSVWNYVTNVTVQSNATLTAVQENFPNADIVVEEGGTWNQSGMPIWKGPAGNNEGGAWSDLSGWTIPFVPTNVAILQAPASTRYVTNLLADRFVNELRMDDNSKNRIRLEADMTVGTLVGGGNNVIDVGTNTLTFYSAAFVGDPMGTGKVIKNGASGTEIRYAGSFAGDMIVNEGSFSMSYTDYSSYKSLRATNSAGYISIGTLVYGLPDDIYLMGDGGGDGALRISSSDVDSDIHMLGDASISVVEGQARELSGDMMAENGPCVFTKYGAGTAKMTHIAGYSFSNMIVVAAGTLEAYSVWNYMTNVTIQSNATLVAAQAHFPTADIVVEPGGVWVQSDASVWKGLSGNNEGGDWSDPNNWTIPTVPTNNAIIQAPGSLRYVTNTVAGTYVGELQMDDNADNRLRLAADMTISNLVGGTVVVIDIGTNTLTVLNTSQIGDPTGTGILKLYSSADMRYMNSFNGTFEVHGGGVSCNHNNHDGAGIPLIILTNNAWISLGMNISVYPQAIDLHSGKIHFEAMDASDTLTSTIRVGRAGGTISVSPGKASQRNEFTGPLFGPGILTVHAPVTNYCMPLESTWHFDVTGAEANGIVAATGHVDVTACTLRVENEDAATAREYVVLDYSSPQGYRVGEFAAIEDMKPDWQITYTGTSLHPDCIVLVPPPRGTVFLSR